MNVHYPGRNLGRGVGRGGGERIVTTRRPARGEGGGGKLGTIWGGGEVQYPGRRG